jgi:hypothetical protein
MSRTCIQAATTFALTPAQVQAHLRIVTADADATDLAGMIAAAQGAVENFTDLALTTQKWRLSLWDFPDMGGPHDTRFYDDLCASGTDPIKLLPCPVVTIDTFKYLDQNGVSQDLNSSLYILDLDASPAIVVPAYNVVWPIVREQPAAVKIETTNGWAAVANVPPQITQAMLLTIGNWYENRETAGELPDAAKALLWPFRVWS